MNVSLSSEMKRIVNDKVRAGLYPTPNDVIREGLRLLQTRDSLRADVHAGFQAIKRGEYEDYDEHTTKKLAEDVKTRGRARLAAKKPKNTTR